MMRALIELLRAFIASVLRAPRDYWPPDNAPTAERWDDNAKDTWA